jgi:hypothetical protein
MSSVSSANSSDSPIMHHVSEDLKKELRIAYETIKTLHAKVREYEKLKPLIAENYALKRRLEIVEHNFEVIHQQNIYFVEQIQRMQRTIDAQRAALRLVNPMFEG